MAINIPNVKIFKAANDKSTLDITSMLTGDNVYTRNKYNEEVYKGRIIIAIAEHHDKKKDYEKAYITKTKIKPILHHIINHTFPKFYGTGINYNVGFHDYGGSKTENGIRGRKFSIFFTDRKQYCFQIEEGPAVEGNNGVIKMTNVERRVQKYLGYEEALEMAHELKDYIQQVELLSAINGKPLYTLLPKLEVIANQG